MKSKMLVKNNKITIRIIPKSNKNEIIGFRNNLLIIKLKAVPKKGKANKELIKFLSKEFKIPQKNFTILKGELSKTKVLEIEKLTKLNY